MSDFILGDIGIEIINFFQNFSPLLDPIFILFTLIGNGYTYILIASLIYWLYSKKIGINLAFIILISVYVNSLIKGFVGWERPFSAHPTEVKTIIKENGYSFVSGHAQYAASFFGSIIYYFKNNTIIKYLFPLSIVMMIFVPLSRVYLAVHYPSDIVVGFIVGLLVIYAYITVIPGFLENLEEYNFWTLFSFTILISVIMLIVEIGIVLIGNNDLEVMESLAFAPGGFFGAFLGLILERRELNFTIKPNQKLFYVTRSIIGITLVGLSYLIPSLLLKPISGIEAEIIRHYIQYFFIGLSVSFLAPYVFTKFENYFSKD